MKINMKKLAEMAMLNIPENQVERRRQELCAVLSMIEKLPDSGNKSPVCIPAEEASCLREDTEAPSFARGEWMQNTPHELDGYVAIP